MPYAQVHYLLGEPDWFQDTTPATSSSGTSAATTGFTHCMLATAPLTAGIQNPVHGIVLGFDGQKMSKSLRNYPDVTEVFDRDGSDAMRWF